MYTDTIYSYNNARFSDTGQTKIATLTNELTW